MSLVSETRLDMDDHSQRFCRAKLQVNALLQQPEAGSVITRTPRTVMSALASSPLNPPAPRGASSPAPRANRRYAPPNQGNRAGRIGPAELPPHTGPPACTLVETRPRCFTAQGTD